MALERRSVVRIISQRNDSFPPRLFDQEDVVVVDDLLWWLYDLFPLPVWLLHGENKHRSCRKRQSTTLQIRFLWLGTGCWYIASGSFWTLEICGKSFANFSPVSFEDAIVSRFEIFLRGLQQQSSMPRKCMTRGDNINNPVWKRQRKHISSHLGSIFFFKQLDGESSKITQRCSTCKKVTTSMTFSLSLSLFPAVQT